MNIMADPIGTRNDDSVDKARMADGVLGRNGGAGDDGATPSNGTDDDRASAIAPAGCCSVGGGSIDTDNPRRPRSLEYGRGELDTPLGD
jgi:hypothetical protein